MRWPSSLVLVLVLAIGLGSCVEPSPAPKDSPRQTRSAPAPSNGFGDAIAWRTLDDGLHEMAQHGRPLMLLVHASWCGKCKALKPKFSDDRLAAMSERFVMVNVDQDAVPESQAYGPDGTYIPRVLFISPQTGEVDESLQNPGRHRYRYYYTPGDDLVSVMKRALVQHGSS